MTDFDEHEIARSEFETPALEHPGHCFALAKLVAFSIAPFSKTSIVASPDSHGANFLLWRAPEARRGRILFGSSRRRARVNSA